MGRRMRWLADRELERSCGSATTPRRSFRRRGDAGQRGRNPDRTVTGRRRERSPRCGGRQWSERVTDAQPTDVERRGRQHEFAPHRRATVQRVASARVELPEVSRE